MLLETTTRRVGIFHSVEIQEQLVPGEWVRNDEASTSRLPDMVNDFLEDNDSQIVFVSSPTVVHVETAEDGSRRSYRTSISIIYDPMEEVNDETTIQAEVAAKAQKFADELSAGLAGTLGNISFGEGSGS
jgi:hypothetical protein